MAILTDMYVLFFHVSENVTEIDFNFYLSILQVWLCECLVLMKHGCKRLRRPWADRLTTFTCREKGVDCSDARRPSRRHGSGLLSAQTTRQEVQLHRLGRAAPSHRVWIGAVPAGGGVQLQEIPPLQHQRYHISLKRSHKATQRVIVGWNEDVHRN